MAKAAAKLDSLITVADFHHAAKAALRPEVWDYFRSGADQQLTVQANRVAFRRLQLLPRVLADVSTVDTSTMLFGERLGWPVLAAPVAYQKLAHKSGEVGMARGCGDIIYTISTMATTPLEEICAGVPGPKWFQLYVQKDRRVSEALVRRAQNAGCKALVVTVDTPVLGRRVADARNGFELPRGLTRANLEPYFGADHNKAAGSELQEHFRRRGDPSLSWNDINWLRSLTTMPILLKGILRADDAKRAVDSGVQGIVVSNHGGRQLDGVPAAIEALPAVVAAVYGRVPVLVDGGVRWGTDIVKALALGAGAVMLGRPLLWGLAAGGEAGVARVLELLRDEFTRAMALCGCRDIAAVSRELLRRPPGSGETRTLT